MQEQHLSDFDFELPPELIAQYPLENRTASRLLHITKDVIEDCTFTDIEGFLHEGDLLVANNTKVIKARLLGRKATGGNVEALIERVTGERTAISMVRASKSPKPGTVLYFEADGIEFERPSEHLFSFNNPLGACPRCEGYGKVIGIDEDLVIPDKSKTIYEDAVACWRGETMRAWKDQLVANAYKFDFPIHTPFYQLSLIHI